MKKRQGPSSPVVVIVGISVVATVICLIQMRSRSRLQSERLSSSQSEVAHREVRSGERGGEIVQNPGAPSSVPTKTEKKSPEAATEAGAPGSSVSGRFAGDEELAEFRKLKSHVFLSEDRKQWRERLLRDTRFLKSLEAILKTPALQKINELSLVDAQSQAIEVLLAARTMEGEGSVVAGEVLRSVILDRKIEGNDLSLRERQALGGVKAEVLYEWTASEPAVAQAVVSWLPGPVSEKIWQNVQSAHRENELESLEAVRAESQRVN